MAAKAGGRPSRRRRAVAPLGAFLRPMIETVLDGHPAVLVLLATVAALLLVTLITLVPLIYGVVFARRERPARRVESLLRAAAEVVAALRRPHR